ncbi:MAG: heme o synthase [Bacteroidota bacterium]
MISERVKEQAESGILTRIKEGWDAYSQLTKFKLSTLVALSGMHGYLMAAGRDFDWFLLCMVGLGAMLVTGASNILNQIFEKEYDKLMARTANRPLPSGKMTTAQGVWLALLLGIGGVYIMGHFFNLPAALFSIIALLSYAFVYTPMKRISPIAVFVGAIPGALPPLIGWVAHTGTLGDGAIILFIFQFFWQFPHFWAIAWQMDEDYQKAGFKMLPTAAGRTKFSALLILIYTLALVPLSFFAVKVGMVGWWGFGGLALCGALFAIPAFALYKSMEKKRARQVMFASFFYLPLIQVVFLVG